MSSHMYMYYDIYCPYLRVMELNEPWYPRNKVQSEFEFEANVGYLWERGKEEGKKKKEREEKGISQHLMAFLSYLTLLIKLKSFASAAHGLRNSVYLKCYWYGVQMYSHTAVVQKFNLPKCSLSLTNTLRCILSRPKVEAVPLVPRTTANLQGSRVSINRYLMH